jgi:hypothetical protein
MSKRNRGLLGRTGAILLGGILFGWAAGGYDLRNLALSLLVGGTVLLIYYLAIRLAERFGG